MSHEFLEVSSSQQLFFPLRCLFLKNIPILHYKRLLFCYVFCIAPGIGSLQAGRVIHKNLKKILRSVGELCINNTAIILYESHNPTTVWVNTSRHTHKFQLITTKHTMSYLQLSLEGHQVILKSFMFPEEWLDRLHVAAQLLWDGLELLLNPGQRLGNITVEAVDLPGRLKLLVPSLYVLQKTSPSSSFDVWWGNTKCWLPFIIQALEKLSITTENDLASVLIHANSTRHHIKLIIIVVQMRPVTLPNLFMVCCDLGGWILTFSGRRRWTSLTVSRRADRQTGG